MADPHDQQDRGETVPRRSPLHRAARWGAGIVLGVIGLLALVVGFLHTPPGRQFIVDQVASYAPASGLSVDVGRIEGSVLWSATLYDVRLRDAEDVLFLEIPQIDLNWRPFTFLFRGLDVRHLVLRRGTLYAAPELRPGDPDAPILPDFDIRVDRFVIDDLSVAESITGAPRTVDFVASADIRDGLVHLDAGGELGGGDVFTLLVDAAPDADRFDLDGRWQAPAGGFLAALVGSQQDFSARISGDGMWTNWEGELLAEQGDSTVLDFDLYNQSGLYRLVGRARPGGYVEGLPARALGEMVMLSASGMLQDSVLEGDFVLRARGVNADGAGTIDLADNAFSEFSLAVQLLDPALFSPDILVEDAEVTAMLDGPFSNLSVGHRLEIGLLDAAGTPVRGIVQDGTLTYIGGRVAVPLDIRIARVTSGNDLIDPRLVNGRIGGTLVYADNALQADRLAVQFRGLRAQLALASNLDTGVTRLSGPVRVADLDFDGVGQVDGQADIRLAFGGAAPWSLNAQLRGEVNPVVNETVVTLAGESVSFAGGIALGGAQPIVFDEMRIDSAKLNAVIDGRVEDGETLVTGTGEHTEYGPFALEATVNDDGPRGTLELASPLPAAGLEDVLVALEPSEDGFRIEASGQSLLGPFDGLVNLRLPEEGDIAIGVTRLDVAQTRVTGDLRVVEGGIAGALDLSRGGVDGTIALAARSGGQGFDVDLAMRNASFTGESPITIARGTITAEGLIAEGDTSVTGNASLQGVAYGNLFLGRVAARGQLADGVGRFDAALTGQRGSRFEVLLNGEIAPERITLAADGSYAGRAISMPRPAVLLASEDGGWELQRSQLSYGGGFAIASGHFGGADPATGRLALSAMPLSLAGALSEDLGLGGTVSGVVDLASSAAGMPTGEARLVIAGLTRSSALLTSQPLDIALVADLSEDLAQARAVLSGTTGSEDQIDGRLQARIADMPQGGGLGARLFAGDLRAGLRLEGSAAALWRLAAIDLLDVTGDVAIAASVRGTLAEPQLTGSLGGDDLRVRSALTGTDVTGASVRGRFRDSRIDLTSFSGTAPNGGRVSGSGFVDLAGLGADRGPQIDIRLAARNAEILDLPAMGARVTGPLRIVSNGIGGTVAGRLDITEARWRLGGAEAMAELPSVAIREINLPPDARPVGADSSPWRFLIDASADNAIMVDGMGLDSEWRGDIRMRGTTADPRIGGEVQIVPRQGFYSFAGVRFDLTRGRIAFDENVPIDPRVDLLAETDINSISVAVSIEGEASNPAITFTSTPALPEEELLAQMLFGGSVTNLSATDALQLGAALASLRGGSGLGPINQLRDAVGVDRLRLIAADPALGRGAAVAIGKNISRRFYAEIITDGAGYNATDLEFRITSWLSLLATVNTIGRNAVAAQYNRDY